MPCLILDLVYIGVSYRLSYKKFAIQEQKTYKKFAIQEQKTYKKFLITYDIHRDLWTSTEYVIGLEDIQKIRE